MSKNGREPAALQGNDSGEEQISSARVIASIRKEAGFLLPYRVLNVVKYAAGAPSQDVYVLRVGQERMWCRKALLKIAPPGQEARPGTAHNMLQLAFMRGGKPFKFVTELVEVNGRKRLAIRGID